MTATFRATIAPSDELLTTLSELSPYSPFNSPGYAAALAATNAQACALVMEEPKGVVAGCLGSLAGGKYARQLVISSVPELSRPGPFWEGVFEFCSEQSVADLDVRSFASRSADLPESGPSCVKQERSEFIIDLTDDSVEDSFSKNHKRNIRKARRAGLEVFRSNDRASYEKHVEMMLASMDRRSSRGESVPTPRLDDFELSLLAHEVGELFQCRMGEQLVASIFILKSMTSGYYLSAGTLPEGMRLGASPLLISQVADILRSEGYQSLNLGGAGVGEDGLRRFKSGFGAEEIALSASRYTLMSPVEKNLRRVAQKLLPA